MTGRIIGAPPAKRGATFADVPDDGAFSMEDPRDGGRVRCIREGDAAVSAEVNDTERFHPEPGEPVVMLTPVEPEPDPAVTTYGELEPGQWGRDGAAVVCKADEGEWYVFRPSDGRVCHEDAETPVRRLTPAEVAQHFAELAGGSFMEHEEPGVRVRALDTGRCLVMREDGEHVYVSPGELGHIVRQGAALLAQRDAKPEEDAISPSAADLDRKWADKFSKPTEDRSKPAPGWPKPEKEYVYWHEISGLMLAPYGRGQGLGDGPVHGLGWEQLRGIQSQAARMLAQYDAQQAEKGGVL